MHVWRYDGSRKSIGRCIVRGARPVSFVRRKGVWNVPAVAQRHNEPINGIRTLTTLYSPWGRDILQPPASDFVLGMWHAVSGLVSVTSGYRTQLLSRVWHCLPRATPIVLHTPLANPTTRPAYNEEARPDPFW